MKNVIAFFILFFVFSSSFAQQNDRKNQVSLSAFKISSVPYEFMIFNKLPLTYNIGVNAVYKYKISDKFNLRGGQSYYKYSYTNGPDFCFVCQDNTRHLQEINTSMGIEFRYFKSKNHWFNFYSGMDITGFVNLARWKTFGHFHDSGFVTVNERKLGLGFQPFTGFSIYPGKRMVISLESSALFGLYKNKQKFMSSSGVERPPFKEEGLKPYAQLFLLRTVSIGWRF